MIDVMAATMSGQVQRWLGHHSASFTLDTYVHLLDNHLGEPLQAAGVVLADHPPLDIASNELMSAAPSGL
jgi:hypothetical protein